MAKPVTLPIWATVTANIATPTSGQQQSGWTVNQIPPSRFQNWWQNNVYTWLVWLNTILFDTGLTFPGTVITVLGIAQSTVSTSTALILQGQQGQSGTNHPGGIVEIFGGQGTGNAVGGSITLAVPKIAASSSSAQALGNALVAKSVAAGTVNVSLGQSVTATVGSPTTNTALLGTQGLSTVTSTTILSTTSGATTVYDLTITEGFHYFAFATASGSAGTVQIRSLKLAASASGEGQIVWCVFAFVGAVVTQLQFLHANTGGPSGFNGVLTPTGTTYGTVSGYEATGHSILVPFIYNQVDGFWRMGGHPGLA